MEIYERLAKENPAAYEPNLAISCFNIGLLYKDTQRGSEAEECFKKALALFEDLESKNPGLYKEDIEDCKANLTGKK